VRQLKNITEQISVIEQQREITAQILSTYLPKDDVERLPALFSKSGNDTKTFNSEREILYQVLFDMKKDMNDMKKLVHDIMNNQQNDIQPSESHFPSTILNHKDSFITNQTSGSEFKTDKSTRESPKFIGNTEYKETFQDAEVYSDTDNQKPLTLEDMERQMIKKTLEKHRGKRKSAADELQISERTLYRKIKEYGIE